MKLDPKCPYSIPQISSRYVRPHPASRAAQSDLEYTYSCSMVYAPSNPTDDYREPGDIWITIADPKSVWVVDATGKSIRWPGNNRTTELSHPWFPELHLWYGGTQLWSWLSRDADLLSSQFRHTQGNTAFALWLIRQSRSPLDAPYQPNFGTDVDAVDHWLDVLSTARPAPVDGLSQAIQNRKRPNDSQGTETAAKRSKNALSSLSATSPPSAQTTSCSVQPPGVHASFPGPPPSGHPPIPEDAPSPPGDTVPANLPSPLSSIPTPDPSDHSPTVSPYQLPPRDCCIGDRPGREWPADTPLCTWPNGMQTVLPFAKDDHAPRNFDADAVHNMAKSTAVRTNVEEDDSPLIWIDLCEHAATGICGLTSDGKTAFSEERRVLDRIQRAFSAGKAALIHRWTPPGPALEFDESGLTSLQGHLDGVYQWQCARRRDQARPQRVHAMHAGNDTQETSTSQQDATSNRDIYQTTSLKQFIRLAKGPTECGNILDAPAIETITPWFVSRLSDDQIAWRVTKDIGFSERARATAKDATKAKPLPGSRAQVAALKSGFARTNLTPQTLKIEMGEHSDSHGPQTISADTFSLRQWDLITMGGFYTFPHHDSNGYGTWLTIRSGGKFWGIRDFKEECLKDHRPEDIVELYRQMASGDEEIIGYQTNKGYSLFLHEGLTLVMPAGMVHEVYTPVNTIATGGHFLNYNFMHLTQWCRHVDQTIQSALTNAEHTSIGRSLARMVLAFTTMKRVIPKRSFLALAHMIMAPQEYQSDKYREEPYIHLAWEDLEEWKEARRIVHGILMVSAEAIFGANAPDFSLKKDALERLSSRVREMSLIAGPQWKECPDTDMLDLSYLVS